MLTTLVRADLYPIFWYITNSLEANLSDVSRNGDCFVLPSFWVSLILVNLTNGISHHTCVYTKYVCVQMLFMGTNTWELDKKTAGTSGLWRYTPLTVLLELARWISVVASVMQTAGATSVPLGPFHFVLEWFITEWGWRSTNMDQEWTVKKKI